MVPNEVDAECYMIQSHSYNCHKQSERVVDEHTEWCERSVCAVCVCSVYKSNMRRCWWFRRRITTQNHKAPLNCRHSEKNKNMRNTHTYIKHVLEYSFYFILFIFSFMCVA